MKYLAKVNAFLPLIWLLAGCGQQPATPPAAEAPVQKPETQTVTEAPKPQTPGAVLVTGICVGRSGKPLVKARLVLGEIVSDDVYRYSKVRLVPNVPTAMTNAEGRFEFKGFKANNEYTIVYQPAGTAGLLPNELLIRTLTATTASITPLLRGFELGTDKVFPERPWGTLYTLLPGHTLYSEGPQMRIWNATVRHKQSGAHLEVRRGAPWTQRFEPGGEIRFEAWSF